MATFFAVVFVGAIVLLYGITIFTLFKDLIRSIQYGNWSMALSDLGMILALIAMLAGPAALACGITATIH